MVRSLVLEGNLSDFCLIEEVYQLWFKGLSLNSVIFLGQIGGRCESTNRCAEIGSGSLLNEVGVVGHISIHIATTRYSVEYSESIVIVGAIIMLVPYSIDHH